MGKHWETNIFCETALSLLFDMKWATMITRSIHVGSSITTNSAFRILVCICVSPGQITRTLVTSMFVHTYVK
jgi:hypothetical protein